MQRPRDVRRDHLQQPPAILIAAALGAVNAEPPHEGRAKQKRHACASLQIRVRLAGGHVDIERSV